MSETQTVSDERRIINAMWGVLNTIEVLTFEEGISYPEWGVDQTEDGTWLASAGLTTKKGDSVFETRKAETEAEAYEAVLAMFDGIGIGEE